jgi:hypothetical protein
VYCDIKTLATFKLDVYEDVLANFPEQLKRVDFNTNKWSDPSYWTSFAEDLVFSVDLTVFKQLDDAQQLHYWKLSMYQFAQEFHNKKSITTFFDGETSLTKLMKNPNAIYNHSRLNNGSPYMGVSLTLLKKGLLDKNDVLFLSLFDANLFVALDAGETYYERNLKGLKNPNINGELKTNLLAVELKRGELPTEASEYVHRLSTIEGNFYLLEVLKRMGKEKFDRGYSYDQLTKKNLFSKIIKYSIPSETDTVTGFATALKTLNVDKKRLIEVASYATQWADWIGYYLKIENLQEAIWWFLAHSTDYMNAEKETIIARYSSIPKNDFSQGAIDVDWFAKVYKNLGKTNWKLLQDSSKYLSDGLGYRRVKLYSSVLLGETKITETLKKIQEKRNKDYVMALGLIPLSKTNPEADLLKRFNLLQTFLKESKQFGAQRQASEKNAVEIGLDNLARNAGFEDRTRFSWSMEAKATQAIMEHATVTVADTTVALVINQNGKADLTISKKGKTLKSIPAKLRKDKNIIKLKEGKDYITKQYSRTRLSLENAMIKQDVFRFSEIVAIMQHPVVKAMLSKLVLWHTQSNKAGFYTDGQWIDLDGKIIACTENDTLRIAHPFDLYQSVQWDLFQKYLFEKNRVQPFKQVFRELYIPTKDEKEHSNRSERYQGHQIQPKKTVALLRSRGWTVSYEEGLQRVFHKFGCMATMYAMADWYSPSDIEAPTLEYVCFYDINTNEHIPLTEVNPVVFSEVMRDVDLVVSVAHVGEVDPEASHSSMEMRGALARESARLFKLDNIEIKKRFILIKGKLGEYNIHLGSGMVKKNGLSLSIIPVHSQHRGRMFLPFVDDDPKSAEIISKMKLLAEDSKIQDPTILAQINS